MKISRLFALAALVLCGSALAKDPEHSFGVLNQRSPTLTAQYWNPILQYVSKVSGVQLRLKMGRTAQETSAMTKRGEFDFLYSNHIFTVENRVAGYKVFARPDEKPIQGQLVVLDDSPIKGLGELQDREVAFANPNAFVGYIVPMNALVKANVKVKPLLSVNQEAAMGQLKAGRVVAAGVNSEVMRDFAEREGIKYRVVWSSKGFLGLPLSSHPSVPAAKVKAVRDAFVGMGSSQEGARILQAASELIKQKTLPGFLPATDKDYEDVVEIYRAPLTKG
jgi:phosphonate transport system substrate-binding protein